MILRLSLFCCLLFAFPIVGRSQSIKKITTVEYRASFINNEVAKSDTLCGMASGCYNVMTFNENGKQTGFTSFINKDEFIFKLTFEYTDNNKLSKSLSYNQNNRISGVNMFFYSDSSLIRYENRYGQEGEYLNFYETYKYNGNELIEKTTFRKDDLVLKQSKYENGKVKEVIDYNNTIEYFEYDENNHLIKKLKYNVKASNEPNELIETEEYFYDNDNKLIEKNAKSDFYPSERYTYAYDEHNNWIREIFFRGGTVKFLKERKIEYY